MTPSNVRCNCGEVLDERPGLPLEERTPCPACGSLGRVVEMAAAIHATSSVSAKLSVDRGLNDLRLAVLGVLVAVALGGAALVPGPWWVRVIAAIFFFLLASFLIAWNRSRHLMMAFVHRITGG